MNRNTLCVLRIKYERVMTLGGKCSLCGYSKNLAALDLHHHNSVGKQFAHEQQRRTIPTERFTLVCANCHRELHSPQQELTQVTKLLQEQPYKRKHKKQQ